MNTGTNAMNETILDQNEEDLLVYEISDEALEGAVHKGSQAGNFTLWSCTALTVCPGP